MFGSGKNRSIQPSTLFSGQQAVPGPRVPTKWHSRGKRLGAPAYKLLSGGKQAPGFLASLFLIPFFSPLTHLTLSSFSLACPMSDVEMLSNVRGVHDLNNSA